MSDATNNHVGEHATQHRRGSLERYRPPRRPESHGENNNFDLSDLREHLPQEKEEHEARRGRRQQHQRVQGRGGFERVRGGRGGDFHHGGRGRGRGGRRDDFHCENGGFNKGSRFEFKPDGRSPPASDAPIRGRNTENFAPSHAPPEMRVLVASPGSKKYDRAISARDVIVVNDMFGPVQDLSLYHALFDELESSGEERQLWQSWHGDTHFIADDKLKWKEKCPTFTSVVDRIADYFAMDVKATRLNWYRDSSEWKPFHHDAAAVKADKARTQNFTVAVSFGLERDVAFEHAKSRVRIAMPQPNGSVYTFAKDVNVIWRHGIPQVPKEQFSKQGRISIIAWGWVDMKDV